MIGKSEIGATKRNKPSIWKSMHNLHFAGNQNDLTVGLMKNKTNCRTGKSYW